MIPDTDKSECKKSKHVDIDPPRRKKAAKDYKVYKKLNNKWKENIPEYFDVNKALCEICLFFMCKACLP